MYKFESLQRTTAQHIKRKLLEIKFMANNTSDTSEVTKTKHNKKKTYIDF